MGSQKPGKSWPLARQGHPIPLQLWNDVMRRMTALDAGGADDPGPSGDGKMRLVQMDEDMGGSDEDEQTDRKATVLIYNAASAAWETTSPAHQLTNLNNCWGEYSRWHEGDRLTVRYHPQSGAYLPLVPQWFEICKATLKGDLAHADESATVDHVEAMVGPSPVDSTAEEMIPNNAYGLAGSDDDVCELLFDRGNETWIVRFVAPTVQEVITASQIDGPNKTFQIKTRDSVGLFDGAESAWTTVHTGDDC